MTAEMQTVTNYMEATNFKKKKVRVKYIKKIWYNGNREQIIKTVRSIL